MDPSRPAVSILLALWAPLPSSHGLAVVQGPDAVHEVLDDADGPGRLRLSYRGKQVNLVVSGEGDLTWTVNGKTRTTHVSGVPNGMELVRTDEVGSGVLELQASPGLELYSFTFG